MRVFHYYILCWCMTYMYGLTDFLKELYKQFISNIVQMISCLVLQQNKKIYKRFHELYEQFKNLYKWFSDFFLLNYKLSIVSKVTDPYIQHMHIFFHTCFLQCDDFQNWQFILVVGSFSLKKKPFTLVRNTCNTNAT